MAAVHFLEKSKETSNKVSICRRQVNWQEALWGGTGFQKKKCFLPKVAQKFQLKPPLATGSRGSTRIPGPQGQVVTSKGHFKRDTHPRPGPEWVGETPSRK